jgi:hypothetical protein
MSRVIVHVDSLVLKHFRHEDQYDVAAGLWEELARVFADPMVIQQMTAKGDVSQLNVDKLRIDQGTKPQCVGVEAARGVGRGIVK